MFWGDKTAIKVQKYLIKQFQKENPNYKVNTLSLGWGKYNEKLLKMIASGSPPDLAYVDGYFFPKYAKKGVLYDISELVSRDSKIIDFDDFYQ